TWTGDVGYYSLTNSAPDGSFNLPVSSELDSIHIVEECCGEWDQIGYSVRVNDDNTLAQPDGEWGVRANNSEPLLFTLYTTDAMVFGHVYDETSMEPVRASINAYTEDNTFWTGTGTWDGGYYELDLIGGLTWIVEVYRENDWYMPAVVDTFTVYTGDNREVDFFLPILATKTTIEGWVRDFNGNPLAGASINLIQTDGPFNARAKTDEAGYYIIVDVPTNHNYDIVATSPKGEQQYYNIWVGFEPVFYDFWMGGAARTYIEGTVWDEESNPIFGAFIFAYRSDDARGEPYAVAQTGEGGWYDMSLEPGNYDLVAGATDFLGATTSILLEDTSLVVDFTLSKPSEGDLVTYTGSVIDPDGGGIGFAYILFASDVYTAEVYTKFDGSFEVSLFPEQNYLVAIFQDGFEEFYGEQYISATTDLGQFQLWPEAYLEIDYAMDVEMDHGGKVLIGWHLNSILSGRVTRFEVWEVGRGPNPPEMFAAEPAHFRHVGTVPIHPETDHYELVAETLHDMETNWYMVTAHGWDIWEYWDSGIWSAYSEDNLPPNVPSSVIVASGELANQVAISWEAVTNEPVQYYTIYQSVGSAAATKYTNTTELGAVIDLTVEGEYSYQITATDFANLESDKSASGSYTYEYLGFADGRSLPAVYALGANYPNPFNPSTTISYQLPEASDMVMRIYDIAGRELRTLIQGNVDAGYHRIVWDGLDNGGAPLSTGVYFYRMTASNFSQTRKMILMK
ncbi:carboxypeptidase regulatory-like domain-containing protein, partial [Candidatus Neomarinimicrobiota bacterium]